MLVVISLLYHFASQSILYKCRIYLLICYTEYQKHCHGLWLITYRGLTNNVPSKLRACAQYMTFRLARTAVSYWRTIGIGHECYCSRGRPMRAWQNKIRGNIVDKQRCI